MRSSINTWEKVLSQISISIFIGNIKKHVLYFPSKFKEEKKFEKDKYFVAAVVEMDRLILPISKSWLDNFFFNQELRLISERKASLQFIVQYLTFKKEFIF